MEALRAYVALREVCLPYRRDGQASATNSNGTLVQATVTSLTLLRSFIQRAYGCAVEDACWRLWQCLPSIICYIFTSVDFLCVLTADGLICEMEPLVSWNLHSKNDGFIELGGIYWGHMRNICRINVVLCYSVVGGLVCMVVWRVIIVLAFCDVFLSAIALRRA